MESLGNKYKISQEQTAPKPENVAKIKALTQDLEVKPSTPEIKKELLAPPEEKIKESDKAYNELIKECPDIAGANLGKAREIIGSSNNKYQFQDVEKVILPALAVGMGIVASQAALIPSFIATLAAGPTGVVTTTGLLFAGTFGVMPIVAGAGFLAYGGYKLFKKIQENRKFKKDTKKLETAWGNT